MKKIYIVNQHYYPELASTGQVFQEIAEHFVKEGNEVTVIAGMPFYHDNIAANLKIKELNGVKVHRLWNTTFKKSSFIGKVLNLLTFQVSLLFYLMVSIHSKATVLVGTNPPMGIVCGAISKLIRRYKLIGVIQDLYPDILVSSQLSSENALIYKILSAIMKKSFNKCDKIITISEDMKTHIQTAYKVTDVQVIYNMVIGEIYSVPHQKLKEQLGFQDKLVVMYSGNFGVAHEYQTLLEAVQILKEESRIHFYIVGGGIHYNLLKKECEQLGFHNIQFGPYVDKEELNNNLNTADVHITIFNNEFKNVLMPSKYYGILACAKPILLITDGENDISRDIAVNKTGFIIGKGNSKELANKLIYLREHPEILDEMSFSAKKLYEEKYAKKIVLQNYSKAVKQVWEKKY